jgi:diguanylate cyclase (GGDEF)-like protein
MMDNLESYLQRIVESLPNEACLLKTGDILSSSPLFAESIDQNGFMRFLRQGGGKESCLPYRSGDSLFSLTPLCLDDLYTLVFLTKVNHCTLIIDPLTGILHRECFERVSRRLIEEAESLKQSMAFLFIDLDGFKAVNDTWGHDSGDIVLKETADRVTRTIRSKDFFFRLGGDEFLIIMVEIKDRMHSCLLARRLITSISAPVALPGGDHAQIGASIGIASYPDNGTELDELIQKADASMYKAKKLGKNNYQLCH